MLAQLAPRAQTDTLGAIRATDAKVARANVVDGALGAHALFGTQAT